MRELQALLCDLPVECTSLEALGIDVAITEAGRSLCENASMKARGYMQASGLTTLADDSGLEVDALGGAPGVESARWAGAGAGDQDRIQLLLERLRDVPATARQAQFRSVAAIATPDGRVYTSEGVIRGLILDRPKGTHGFGYDPVFLIPELGLTMAELEPETKNRISHRARAVRAAHTILRELLREEEEGKTGE